MEQISIVKKRSRITPMIVILLLVILAVLAALYFVGDAPAV